MTPEQLIKHYTSKEAAAAGIGVSFSTIRNWERNKKIPHKMQIVVQHITKNKLVADKELR